MSNPSHGCAAPQKGLAVERRTIGPIAENERFGRARDLFGIWFGMNMSPLTIVTGALATTTMGLPIGWAILAICTGHLVGGVAMALHAAQGPQLGVPQLLQARGQFGMYGAAIIAFIAVANFVGFFASNLVVITQAIPLVFHGINAQLILVLATLVSLIISIFGYKWLRWVTVGAAILVGSFVAFSFVWILVVHHAGGNQWHTGHLTTAGFLSIVAIGAMWQITYAPYVSDYSRYMPARTGNRGAFWATYGGCVSSAIILMILGAVIGSISSGREALAALDSLVGSAGPIMMLSFAVATAAYNSVNTYCSALCSLSVAQTFRPQWIPRLGSRVVVTVLIHAVGLAIALVARDDFVTWFSDFITWILYIMIPWSAINLVDYYIIRRGHYAVEEFFQPGGGRYGNWNIRAIIVYLLGFAAEIPFISTSKFTGVLNHALGGVDIAWVLGFIVCGAAYYAVANRPIREEAHLSTAER
jgi:NCS1 family nucleobase:cation symporter-1